MQIRPINKTDIAGSDSANNDSLFSLCFLCYLLVLFCSTFRPL